MDISTFKVLKHLFANNSAQHLFGDFTYELNSHPDFPSLKSISDTLDRFGFENVPVKLKPEELEKIEDSFLCYIKNKGQDELVLADPIEDHLINYSSEHQKSNSTSLIEFARQFNGVVVLIEFDASKAPQRESDRFRKKQLFNIVLAATIVSFIAFVSVNLFRNFSFLLTDFSFPFFGLTKICGLFLASILVLKDFGHSGSLVDKVCKAGKQADCNTVLQSKYATVYEWVKWSDLGFVYFLSSLLLVSTNSLGVVTVLTLAAFPYVIISLYQQAFLIKKLCPLCLGVTTVLGAEFVLGLNSLSNISISSAELFDSVLLLLITGVLYLTVKNLILTKRDKMALEYRYNRLKRIPEVVTTVVKKEKALILPEGIPMNCLSFGNLEQGSLKVQAFLSLRCDHCGRLFFEFNELIKNANKLHIELFLSFNPKDIGHLKTMEEILKAYNSNGSDKAWERIRVWYAKRAKTKSLDITHKPSQALEKIYFTTNHLIKANQIFSSPQLYIEGFEKSSHYNLAEYLEHSEKVKSLTLKDQREMIINT